MLRILRDKLQERIAEEALTFFLLQDQTELQALNLFSDLLQDHIEL